LSLAIVIINDIIIGDPFGSILPLTHLLSIYSHTYFEQEKKETCTNLCLVIIVVTVAALIHQDEYPTMGNDFRARGK
jgi:hypothetical protein